MGVGLLSDDRRDIAFCDPAAGSVKPKPMALAHADLGGRRDGGGSEFWLHDATIHGGGRDAIILWWYKPLSGETLLPGRVLEMADLRWRCAW